MKANSIINQLEGGIKIDMVWVISIGRPGYKSYMHSNKQIIQVNSALRVSEFRPFAFIFYVLEDYSVKAESPMDKEH